MADFFLMLLISFCISNSGFTETVRVAVLQFGTVSRELDVIKHHGLAKREGIDLEVIPLASVNAVNVALQANRVDLVVGDWIWVSRQRRQRYVFTSSPYSLSAGSLLLAADSKIKTLADFQDKRLGVASREASKNWLILWAYSMKSLGKDIRDIVQPVFASSPLLNQLMLQGDLDGVLNFWHYSAQLQAAGIRLFITVDGMLNELSIKPSVLFLAWIFRQDWAKDNPQRLQSFLNASFTAKKILFESDAEWQRIKTLTQAKSDRVLNILRMGYRSSIPRYFSEAQYNAASRLYQLLAEIGGTKLVGSGFIFSEWDILRRLNKWRI